MPLGVFFAFGHCATIARMSDDITYEVSIEEQDGARKVWRVLLRTKDRVAAQTLFDSLRSDEGVKARMLEQE